jgi:hypothetical protein
LGRAFQTHSKDGWLSLDTPRPTTGRQSFTMMAAATQYPMTVTDVTASTSKSLAEKKRPSLTRLKAAIGEDGKTFLTKVEPEKTDISTSSEMVQEF